MISEARAILDTDKIQRLAQRFRDINEDDDKDGLDEMELMCCASLAHNGLFSSLRKLRLYDADLSPVPAQHLASLASCVTGEIFIDYVSCDLVSILTSLKCKTLFIGRQSLEREETQALVQAMESGVEEVRLGMVTLDFKALAEYRGQGVCHKVDLMGVAVERYKEDLRKWARSKNWRENMVYEFMLWTFTRPGPDEMLMFFVSQL